VSAIWKRAVLFGAGAALVGLSADATEPVKIGLIASITGPWAEQGSFTINGARLAAEEINKGGGVLGRPIELRIEDNLSTNPGAVLAFSKLAGEGGVIAVLGPGTSSQTQAASPSIAKAGIPTIIAATDTSLTHQNNRWLFRVRPNDSYSSRVIADFGVNTLKLKKWAIVYSTDTFGSGGAKALTEALKALGVTPVFAQGYTNNSQDFTAMVLAIKKSGADVLSSYMTIQADLAIFSKQLRQLGVNIPVVGSPSVASVSARTLAGDALYGTYAVTDFTPNANASTQAFTGKYRDKYGIDPDFYSSWPYDAIQILAFAIKNANSTEPEAIRNAILAVRDFEGLEGTYVFDHNGDGLHGYNVVRNEDGKIVFIKRVDFPPE
jgi:branched-chain amino acid transport system substrate-binding protein